MPHTFRLREQLGNSDAIFALEEQPKHVGTPAAQAMQRVSSSATGHSLRGWFAGVVGQVRKRYDAEVAAQQVGSCELGLPVLVKGRSCSEVVQAGPNGQLDAAYRALSRARDEAASKKTRTMQVWLAAAAAAGHASGSRALCCWLASSCC